MIMAMGFVDYLGPWQLSLLEFGGFSHLHDYVMCQSLAIQKKTSASQPFLGIPY